MLSVYKIKIKHIAGNKNTTADALSQKFIEDKNEDKPKQAIPNEFINKSIFPAEELSMSRPWRRNKTYLGNIMTYQQLDTLVSRKHYAKCQNNTHGLDSNNSSPTTSKAVKTAKDTRSTDIL